MDQLNALEGKNAALTLTLTDAEQLFLAEVSKACKNHCNNFGDLAFRTSQPRLDKYLKPFIQFFLKKEISDFFTQNTQFQASLQNSNNELVTL